LEELGLECEEELEVKAKRRERKLLSLEEWWEADQRH